MAVVFLKWKVRKETVTKENQVIADSKWKNILEWIGLALLLIAVLAWQSLFGYEVVTY